MAVSNDALEICRINRIELIRERLRSTLQEALQSQMSVDEIRGLVDEECASLTAELAEPP